MGTCNMWCEEYENTYHGQGVKVARSCCTVVQVITSKELLTRLICCFFKIWMKNEKMVGCFITCALACGCVLVGKQLIG